MPRYVLEPLVSQLSGSHVSDNTLSSSTGCTWLKPPQLRLLSHRATPQKARTKQNGVPIATNSKKKTEKKRRRKQHTSIRSLSSYSQPSPFPRSWSPLSYPPSPSGSQVSQSCVGGRWATPRLARGRKRLHARHQVVVRGRTRMLVRGMRMYGHGMRRDTAHEDFGTLILLLPYSG
jgi:hypothetical protein